MGKATKQRPEIRVSQVAFDTLALSAAIHGGFGASSFGDDGTPVCLAGHKIFGDVASSDFKAQRAFEEVQRKLRHEYVSTFTANDAAVQAINKRKGKSRNNRVTMAEYAAELNLVPDASLDASYYKDDAIEVGTAIHEAAAANVAQ